MRLCVRACVSVICTDIGDVGADFQSTAVGHISSPDQITDWSRDSFTYRIVIQEQQQAVWSCCRALTCLTYCTYLPYLHAVLTYRTYCLTYLLYLPAVLTYRTYLSYLPIVLTCRTCLSYLPAVLTYRTYLSYLPVELTCRTYLSCLPVVLTCHNSMLVLNVPLYVTPTCYTSRYTCQCHTYNCVMCQCHIYLSLWHLPVFVWLIWHVSPKYLPVNRYLTLVNRHLFVRRVRVEKSS